MVTNGVLKDEQQRIAIATELDKTLLVEAAAGTGKTTSLVTRMVALIREGKAEAQHIAAITFTRKAAAHLRQKFQNELEKAHAAEQAAEVKQRLARALDEIDRLYIGTIHSFCAQLIRERPVEAGIDPEFTEIEEAADIALRDMCWHEYADRLFVEESPMLRQLEAYGIEFDRLQATYNILCYYPDVTPVVAAAGKPDFNRARGAVSEFLGFAERVMPVDPPGDGWDSLQSRMRRALRLQKVLDTARDTEFVRLLEALDGSGTVVLKRWPDSDAAKDMKERFAEFRENVVGPALREWREYLHPILINAVTPAVNYFTDYRRTNALLNFQDLLMIARDLLKNNPRIRRYFRQRFSHLLVDEFQDTDPIQAELMLYLTGEDSHEMDWHRVKPAPGALFVVGDPKQSIYRFRRADIATYNRVREIVEGSGGEVITLSTNFRSVESICNSVNTTFDDIFPPQSTEEQAGQVHLHFRRPDGAGLAGIYKLEHSTSEIKNRLNINRINDAHIARTDADAIARWIRGAIDSGMEIQEGDGRSRKVEPGDFLIAVRRKKNLRKYTQALESLGIPFEITGAGGFAESEEIRNLMPFLKCVVDPDDAISVVAYLRGPLCGTEDSALLEYKLAGGSFNYISGAPTGVCSGIVEAFGFLREAREWSRKLPPAAAFARIFERLGILPDAACREFGNTRAGNLMKMLTLARSLSIEGESFAGIVMKLEELLSADIEEMGIEPGRSDAVRLMNLHKAKGLEAPVVFLADPTVMKDHDPEYYIDRASDPPRGHFVFWMPQGEFQKREIALPLDWESKAAFEGQFQDAEEDRLLYVAATRAMNILVVSVYLNESKKPAERQGPWCRLIDGSTPELPCMSIQALAGDEAQVDLSIEFPMAREKLTAVFDAARRPSYAVANVTKITHNTESVLIPRAERGHGSGWGRVLHGTLEALMRSPDIDVRLLGENGLRQEEMPVDDAGEIVRLVESVRSSEIWVKACSAEKRFVEVPFALNVPSADLGITDGPAETVLGGVVDLVYWDGESWIIVDYKSDVTVNRLRGLIDRYAPQVRCYQRYWEQLTGEPVRSALYFVDNGHVEWL